MKKIGLVILGIGVLLIGIISFSKEEKKVLVEEEINNSNTSLVFMLQDEEGNYNKSEELPSSGYSFNTSKSVCSNNTTPTWEDNKLYLNNLNKNGTSCYLYFDIFSSAKNTILSNSKVNEGIPDFSQVATTDEGIYKVEDDWGTSYYFRGAVTNNYVKFAGYYWRIIRINGDGSIRMIYDGTSAHANGESSDDRKIQENAFNSNYYDFIFVGYMYQNQNWHGIELSSDIKNILDEWYKNYMLVYEKYINTNSIFCGDRTTYTANYFDGYNRLYNLKKPTYVCTKNIDLYSTNESSLGNQALEHPIGLISADEVSFAGGVVNNVNNNFYLYTGFNYWTITPAFYDYGFPYVFMVDENGNYGASNVNMSWGVRPVINLASDVTLSGTGTASDPYIVEGAE